jgi:hypothetical protein
MTIWFMLKITPIIITIFSSTPPPLLQPQPNHLHTSRLEFDYGMTGHGLNTNTSTGFEQKSTLDEIFGKKGKSTTTNITTSPNQPKETNTNTTLSSRGLDDDVGPSSTTTTQQQLHFFY